ncbi:hypothetical protein C3747_235g40 [Trypanosoma cruzi]|uniref:Uncharacterized protein n=1 Tax=Trypanosoma cruzi TaxID=5693 RepID=A0A2V2VNP6_TRYCR|nr:hypothetical protein C3747_235g40 [Trypanosoma cruzi]
MMAGRKGGKKKKEGAEKTDSQDPNTKIKSKNNNKTKKKMGKLEALEIEEAFSAGKCQTQPSPPNRHPSTLPQLLGVPSPSSLPSYIPFPKNVKRPPLPSSLFAALASAGKHTKEKSINQERKERERDAGAATLVLLHILLALHIRGLCADLLVVLLQGGEILTGLRELTLLHTLTNVPVHERTLAVHKVELVVDAREHLRDGGRVGNHAHRALHLGEVATGHHRRGLVVDAALEASG